MNTQPREQSAVPGAIYALSVLTAMNLLNYLDRYVPSAVKDLFKGDLGFSDTQTSLPLTAFILVYMLTSPLFGDLADKWSRPKLIAMGVALWSLATAAAALAQGFLTFFIARALVGVGEAAYATIAPSLLSDYYPPTRRNRALTIFYVAIPVGAALGFVLGGFVGQHWGWRAAFLVAGLPGLFAAALALRIKDPGRGGFDEKLTPMPWPQALRSLQQNKKYLIAVLGYTLVTFASGGMADWFPTLLTRLRGFELQEAGSVVGTMTVVGGLGGTLVGGFLADKMRGRFREPYLAVSAISMVLSAAAAAMAIVVHDKTLIALAIFLAQFFLWFYSGPINTLLVNCVDAGIRARAFSISILVTHLFGDAISPPIIGAISDTTGDLVLGVWSVPLTLLLGGVAWAWGWKRA